MNEIAQVCDGVPGCTHGAEKTCLPIAEVERADDAYGIELDRRLALEQTLAAVWKVVEMYESCGPKQQSARDVLSAVRTALEGAQ